MLFNLEIEGFQDNAFPIVALFKSTGIQPLPQDYLSPQKVLVCLPDQFSRTLLVTGILP